MTHLTKLELERELNSANSRLKYANTELISLEAQVTALEDLVLSLGRALERGNVAAALEGIRVYKALKEAHEAP